MNRLHGLALGAVWLTAGHAAADPSAHDQLHRLFAERFAWHLQEHPEAARARGDYSTADLITDASLAAIERRHEATRACLARLRAIDRAALDEQDLVNYELFELGLQQSVDSHRFRTFLMPIGGRSGPQQDVPEMGQRVRFDSTVDYTSYIQRLRQAPVEIDHVIERMKLGLAEGRTPAQVTLAGLPGQFEAVLAQGLDSLRDPLLRFPVSVNADQRREITQRFDEEIMPQLRAAMVKLRDFVVRDYLPHCRDSTAAIDLPDGEAYYNHQLAVHTTTTMNAREIHELGLSEVARIRAEMLAVIRASDFMASHSGAASLADDELFKAFIAYLRSDSRFYHDSEESLLTGYRDICKRVDAWLPKLFKTLPRLPYGVRPVPRFMAPTQTTAYYQPGDIRNAEAGYFFANTYALDQRPKYEMIPLALHEAVPGHHLQIAIAQELEGLPEFRKDADFTVFVEGWALYSERLGIEMGLFSDPYDDFGRLLYEMWRACRLVVDPGMHALGWSRQRAIDFMLANTALSPLNIENEIDRYINWPGQATGYKIGELRIRALRAEAEQAMGAKFDLRRFHDVVLGAGAVPMSVLERRVRDWIKAN